MMTKKGMVSVKVINLDKEEFLERLDLRISIIACLLSTHEKYLCRDIQNKKAFIDMQKAVDNANEQLIKGMEEIDRKIQKQFSELREQYDKDYNEQGFE